MTQLKNARLTRLGSTGAQRWRNGGGWTRELLIWPTGDPWRVRVSVADIEADGPFSAFPGVERHFAVLEGNGVELTIDGAPQRVTRADPAVVFAGDATTSCRMLDGPTRDLNLMVRGPRGALVRVVPGDAWNPPASACGLFAVAPGRCSGDNDAMTVPAFSLLWFARAPAALAFDAAGWWLAA